MQWIAVAAQPVNNTYCDEIGSGTSMLSQAEYAAVGYSTVTDLARLRGLSTS